MPSIRASTAPLTVARNEGCGRGPSRGSMTSQALSYMRTRLGAMMFFEYIIWGAWYVTLTNYLTTTLKFSGTEAGAVFGTAALASLLSPFFVGLIADRFFATERVMATLYLLAAACMYMVTQVSSFASVYTLM